MATSDNQDKIFQCSKCQNNLDMVSKTLTCLHSLCGRCLDEEFQGETIGNGQCPECQELVKIDQLTLTPYLVNSLKCQRFESTEIKCNVCLEKGKESLAKIWCKDCNKFFCDECNWFHKSFLSNHHSMVLDGKGKGEVQKAMRTDLCNIHRKVEGCYCDQCNTCLCDTCYKTHLIQSPQCPSPPISVKEEAVKKRTFQGPTLLKNIEELKNNLEERNRKSRIYSEQLERDWQLKCKEIWKKYEDILEELRDKMINMCEELKFLKDEQVKKWRESMEENERQLKKLEIWYLNLHHVLKKDEKDKNEMICGVELVGGKLASSSAHLHQIITKPMRKYELSVEFSDSWQQFIEGLKNEKIASGSLNLSANLIQFETEWNLPESNVDHSIASILVSQKDNHIFLADYENQSIMEFKESGELIFECILIHEGRKFNPIEMFFTSSEIFGVNCWWIEKKEGENAVKKGKLFFLERQNFSPFLKITKIVDKTKQNFPLSYSVCQLKKKILICDLWKFHIDFYTENGEYIKTIDTGLSGGSFRRIRSDLSTENIWGAVQNTRKIFCFDENGQKLKSFETKENIIDFSINEFGNVYFCNYEGIFSFLPEKYLYKFQTKSEKTPKIFVSKEKVFVRLKIDGKNLIRIFKIIG